jgi:outer membrane protein TolC
VTGIESRPLAVAPLMLLIALGAATAGGSEGGAAATASEKVLATMRAAIERSPETALRVAELEAEVARIRSTAGAGAPTLSWQREGIGPGLDQRANAADYLRLNLPFNPPWRLETGKELQQSTARLLRVGGISGRLEVAALAARRWLDLAAETEMAALAEGRVGRLDRTLAIQTRRYELGEISGSERAQLELELARDRDLLRQSENRRFAAEQQLEALAPGGFPLPATGDLARLVEQTAAAGPDAGSLEVMLGEAPVVRR